MKHYTLQEAAQALGVDTETLHAWIANIQHETYTDPYDHQLYVLDEAQLEQLAREHNTHVLAQQANLSRAMQGNVADVHPIPLDAPTMTIGRFQNNAVILDHPQVSGYHARLEQSRSGGYRIVDLGSTNHVYVN